MQAKGSLEVGGLYRIPEHRRTNVYADSDTCASFYEVSYLHTNDPFIVLELTDNSEFCNADRYHVYDTALVLTKDGLGRVIVSSDEYNGWSYEKVFEDSLRRKPESNS